MNPNNLLVFLLQRAFLLHRRPWIVGIHGRDHNARVQIPAAEPEAFPLAHVAREVGTQLGERGPDADGGDDAKGDLGRGGGEEENKL